MADDTGCRTVLASAGLGQAGTQALLMVTWCLAAVLPVSIETARDLPALKPPPADTGWSHPCSLGCMGLSSAGVHPCSGLREAGGPLCP